MLIGMTSRLGEPGGRVVTLPRPQPPWMGGGLIAAGGSGLAIVTAMLGAGLYSTAALVGAPLFFAVAAYGFVGFRTLRVERRGDAVLIPGQPPLPAGKGDVVVEPWIRYVSSAKGGSRPVRYYRISHGSAELYARCEQPLLARAFAEGLCRLGGYRMQWQSVAAAPQEVREPEELDRPLVERLAVDPARLQRARPPYQPLVEWEGLPGGAVRLWRRLRRKDVFLVYGVVVGLALLAGFMGWVSNVGEGGSRGTWFLLGVGIPGLATATAWLGLRLLLPSDLLVSPKGIERRWRLFGGAPVYRRLWDSKRIESLYLESHPLVRLVVAGDDLFEAVHLAGRDLEPAWVRYLLQRGLLGLGVPADGDAPATKQSAPAELAQSGCPRCLGEPLAAGGGELDEQTCATCAGRFLPPHGAERLVLQELAISRQMLRELVGLFGGERLRCPGCRTRMSAVQLKGVATDLCTGCGGVWLDAEELSRLSLGRYTG